MAQLLGPAVLQAAETTPYTHKWPSAGQVLDKNSLPDPADKDEADAVLRRTTALIEHLKTMPGCPKLNLEDARLAELWLAARPWALNGIDDVRFDIIAVDATAFPSSIRHLPAAFTRDW